MLPGLHVNVKARSALLDIRAACAYAHIVMPQRFPFSAIVGQDELKSALILNAVDPLIGGVLIRGEKGTGKSTAVRGFASILPAMSAVAGCPYHCDPDDPCPDHAAPPAGQAPLSAETMRVPLVEVPLNATEDRLVGTLSVERALEKGQIAFSPGLLASANRGMLYVDEVNLFPDHLVDMLLDAAASGLNRVERDGVSVEHPARFVLVGTMNPEEGELRPQFLDRFGLCVHVRSLIEAADRRMIIERRLGFDRNQVRMLGRWERQDQAIAERIVRARKLLPTVRIPTEQIDLIITVATRAAVAGHRADITLTRTACALAALLNRKNVSRDMVLEAARYVLPHRLPNQEQRLADRFGGEPDKRGRSSGEVDKLLESIARDSVAAEAEWHDDGDSELDESDDSLTQVPGSTAAGSLLLSVLGEKKKKRPVTGRG